jgi:hypothetical protein
VGQWRTQNGAARPTLGCGIDPVLVSPRDVGRRVLYSCSGSLTCVAYSFSHFHSHTTALASHLLRVQADAKTSSREAALNEAAYWLLLSTTTSAPSGGGGGGGCCTPSPAEGGTGASGSKPWGVYGACWASGHQWRAWKLKARSSGRSCASAWLSGTWLGLGLGLGLG